MTRRVDKVIARDSTGTRTNSDPARIESLIELARHVNEDDLSSEIRRAIEDPDSYVRANATRMRARGIRPGSRIPADLPWIALIDELRARSAVAEIDHRATPDEVLADLSKIADPEIRSIVRDLRSRIPNQSAGAVLEFIASALAPTNRSLVVFERLADTFAVAILATKAARSAKRLAASSKFGSIRIVEARRVPSESPAEIEHEKKKKPTRAASPAAASWAELAKRVGGVGTVRTLSLIAADPSRLADLRAALPSVPTNDRKRVTAFAELLEGDPVVVAERADSPETYLDAIRFLASSKGKEHLILAAIVRLVERFDLKPGSSSAGRAVVRALSLRIDEARWRSAFGHLPERTRDRLREFVHRQLASKRAEDHPEALAAAAVVGDTTTVPWVKALANQSPSSAEAKRVARVLS